MLDGGVGVVLVLVLGVVVVVVVVVAVVVCATLRSYSVCTLARAEEATASALAASGPASSSGGTAAPPASELPTEPALAPPALPTPAPPPEPAPAAPLLPKAPPPPHAVPDADAPAPGEPWPVPLPQKCMTYAYRGRGEAYNIGKHMGYILVSRVRKEFSAHCGASHGPHSTPTMPECRKVMAAHKCPLGELVAWLGITRRFGTHGDHLSGAAIITPNMIRMGRAFLKTKPDLKPLLDYEAEVAGVDEVKEP